MSQEDYRTWLRVKTYLIAATLFTLVTDVWRLRYYASLLSYRLPISVRFGPFRLHDAPEEEYVATWKVDPATARQQLQTEHGFERFFLSQLQAYSRNETTIFERGNLVYWPNGKTGQWQYHVRLFPTSEGHTEIWAHQELNIFRHPNDHSQGKHISPVKGEQHLRACIDRNQLIRSSRSSKNDTFRSA
ncbi:hypothetical protein K0C01_12270 [Salinarchaeum sp. IM2453]|uniref:hypothetical protein n=1 Tax=Salinarchaeum sp. IM2453 TaxID=2862870 RepID=UPI001C834A0C|nr:hypothetical protein [Salinarchaeum sp. IM2453]QZA88537.1 hypothetical protein K0C01_12270 [Salinarchaeum sp. IM2453]